MAILWDSTGCSVPLPRDENDAEQRDALIFLGAQIEAGNLTADTLREWMVRMLLMERLCEMPPLFGGPQGLSEALYRWRGLVLPNVPEVARSVWMTGRIEAVGERMGWIADNAIEEAATFAPIGSVGSR